MLAALFTGLTYGSIILDRKWRTSHPNELPFGWGYFQALVFLLGGFASLLLPLIARPKSALEFVYVISVMIFGLIGALAGYKLITEKRKWAWWFVVLVQLTIIIINAPYGWKRRSEFR